MRRLKMALVYLHVKCTLNEESALNFYTQECKKNASWESIIQMRIISLYLLLILTNSTYNNV